MMNIKFLYASNNHENKNILDIHRSFSDISEEDEVRSKFCLSNSDKQRFLMVQIKKCLRIRSIH